MREKTKVIILIVLLILIIFAATIILGKKFTITRENKGYVSNNLIIEVKVENFEKEVLNSDKKVLIDFYATWCGPCNYLKPTIEEIASENEDIKIVEIDVDKNEKLVEKYNIQAMPTLIVVENGEEIRRSVGAIPKDEIIELIR